MAKLTSQTGRDAAVELYVAPDGNDAAPGTRRKPFQTLERARAAAREFVGRRAVSVRLAAGVYALERTLEFTAADSGAARRPVVWRAAPGAEVRLSGGREVTGWRPVADEAILRRLAPAARGRVWQADLQALGIRAYGQVENTGQRHFDRAASINARRPARDGGLELFFNDRPMTLARWPNRGFVKIAGLAASAADSAPGRGRCRTGELVYRGARPRRWRDENDIWLHGYWFHDWSDERQKVAGIDLERRVISLAAPHHVYGYRAGQWFYALNLLAELDQPGEWYLDRATGKLYFWPPSPLAEGRAVVSVLDTLATFTEVSHLAWEGLILEAARGTAVAIRGGTGLRLGGCILRNLGGWGVKVEGGRDHRVAGCDLYGLGNGGILLAGGDRRTLAPAGHRAVNNHIHHFSRWNRTYQPALALVGVGNRAVRNLVHDAPHMAVFFSGKDHLIEGNEIRAVCLESNDAGSIYAGRDWTMRGTVIRGNCLRDIRGFRERYAVGVYLDDMFCGTVIAGNIFYRVARAVFIGGGRDNLVENNLLVDCRPALHIDDRGLGWAKSETHRERLRAAPYRSATWRRRYPQLAAILDRDPAAPGGNLIRRNVCFRGEWLENHVDRRPEGFVFRANLTGCDPRFRAPPPESFALRADSPARAIGFRPIPRERIGLYRDQYRRRLPATDRPGGRPQASQAFKVCASSSKAAGESARTNSSRA